MPLRNYPDLSVLGLQRWCEQVLQMRREDIVSFAQLEEKLTKLVSGTAWAAPSNVTEDRAFDADSTTTDEIADVLGTLINDLRAKGIL